MTACSRESPSISRSLPRSELIGHGALLRAVGHRAECARRARRRREQRAAQRAPARARRLPQVDARRLERGERAVVPPEGRRRRAAEIGIEQPLHRRRVAEAEERVAKEPARARQPRRLVARRRHKFERAPRQHAGERKPRRAARRVVRRERGIEERWQCRVGEVKCGGRQRREWPRPSRRRGASGGRAVLRPRWSDVVPVRGRPRLTSGDGQLEAAGVDRSAIERQVVSFCR